MKFRSVAVAVVCTLLSICSLAQTKNFSYIIGHNPNSTDYREAVIAARHQGLYPRVNGQLLGDDWAFSVGTGGGMVKGEWGALFEHSYTTATCTDWNAFPLNATPSATQANLVILTNLYTGTNGLCGTGGPSVLAAYQIGTTAFAGIYGSPDVSYEGASKGLKMVVLEGSNAIVHIITLGSGGTVTAPIKPDGVGTHGSEVALDLTNTTNTHCAAATVHTALASQGVYVDFNNDSGYVGTDGGKIYHIAGIFNGTPTVDWCSGAINSGNPISEIVALPISSVETIFGISNGRLLWRAAVNATGTGITGLTTLLLSSTAGNLDEFMLDSSQSMIFAYTRKDVAGTAAAVYQINTSNTPMTITSELAGGQVVTLPVRLGNFDHTFWTSGPTATGATGYACAYPNGSAGAPTLVSFQFNSSGVMNITPLMTGNQNIRGGASNVGQTCEDIDEFFDGTTDQLFVGVGAGTNTITNRITRWDITTPLTLNSTPPANSVTNNAGGPGGMNADFSAASTNQTNNIYFGLTAVPTTNRCGQTTGVNNYCLVKLTQGALN